MGKRKLKLAFEGIELRNRAAANQRVLNIIALILTLPEGKTKPIETNKG
jgi:hypothetical protein